MTILAGRSVDTSYQLADGRPVRIGNDARATHRVAPTFRVLATMNTRDRMSLFRLSHALQRRFAIVHIGVPDDETFARIIESESALPIEGLDELAAGSLLTDLFSSIGLLGVCPIGAALVKDVIMYARTRLSHGGISPHDAVGEALMMIVLPQLEGLDEVQAGQAFVAVRRALGRSVSPHILRAIRDRMSELLPHASIANEEDG